MIIVSVPTGTPTRVCQNIQEECAKKFRQHVLVVTHNIEFMKVTKVSRKEAASIVKMAEDVEDGEEPRLLT